MLIMFIRRVIWTLLFRTVLPSSHPLTGVLVRIVVGHLHLLLPPDAHDLLAVGVPQLLKQDEQQTHRVQAALSTATHTHMLPGSPQVTVGGGSEADQTINTQVMFSHNVLHV